MTWRTFLKQCAIQFAFPKKRKGTPFGSSPSFPFASKPAPEHDLSAAKAGTNAPDPVIAQEAKKRPAPETTDPHVALRFGQGILKEASCIAGIHYCDAPYLCGRAKV